MRERMGEVVASDAFDHAVEGASVVPMNTRGNIGSPTLTIAAKAARWRREAA